MRGKHGGSSPNHRTARNIPAHAGKTPVIRGSISTLTEHPRASGENLPTLNKRLEQAGTSPRMRGKLRHKVQLLKHSRNIPAHAGKTSGVFSEFLKPKEHPRACGENKEPGHTVFFEFGTSPRMRGKRAGPCVGDFLIRNIPAHAGKTQLAEKELALDSEHPRACGENPDCSSATTWSAGTSPRMRGKL